MSESNIRKGCVIEILKEFQDPGDAKYTWIAVDDAEKGRVRITPLGTGLTFPPVYTVKIEWLKLTN